MIKLLDMERRRWGYLDKKVSAGSFLVSSFCMVKHTRGVCFCLYEMSTG